jgi:exosome complex exonuclease RRP6
VKPQLAFQNKPDNVSATPWKPLLKSKPHAIVPLDKSLGTFTDDLEHQQYDYNISLPLLLLLGPMGEKLKDLTKSQRRSVGAKRRRLERMGSMKSSTNGRFRYKHPYETEILKLHYPDAVYSKAEPVPYLPVDSTTATFVDTFDGVLAMLEELKKAKEIAVDLEHHDARSYIGLVSLMQISTREKDWIVDTLKPWREDLQVLNQVFADPCIIKVIIPFHDLQQR